MLSTEEAARKLSTAGVKLSSTDVAALSRRGSFPNAKRIEGRWQIPSEDIEQYISYVQNSLTNRAKHLNLTQASRELEVEVNKVRELCKYGYLQGAFQNYQDGPWHIPPEAIDNFRQNHKDASSLPSRRARLYVFLSRNRLKSVIAALVTTLTLLFGLISAGADIGGARGQLIEWGLFSAFPSAGNEEVLIVIATFHRTEQVIDTDIQNEIRRAILQTAQKVQLSDLRVEVDPRKLKASDLDKAKAIRDKYGAKIVIWGEDTGVRVTVNYLTSADHGATPLLATVISETEKTQLRDPEGYASFVTKDLPAHLSFLSLFANGQVARLGGDSEKAIEIINQAIDETEFNISLEGIVYAYYTLGYLYSTSWSAPAELITATELVFEPTTVQLLPVDPTSEELEKAIALHSLVIDLSPNGFTESGSVFYERGILHMLNDNSDAALSDFIEYFSRIYPPNANPIVGAHRFRGLVALGTEDYDLTIFDLNYAIDRDLKLDCEIASELMAAHFGRAFTSLFVDAAIPSGKYIRGEGLEDPAEVVILHGENLDSKEILGDFTSVIELSEHCNIDTSFSPLVDAPKLVKETYYLRGFTHWLIGQNEEASEDYARYIELQNSDTFFAPYDVLLDITLDQLSTQETGN